LFRGYSDIDNCTEERERGITITPRTLSTRRKSAIILILIAQVINNMLKYVDWCCTNGRSYIGCCCYDGPQVQTREHVILAKEVGIPYIIVYINKLDFKLGGDMKDLVELEVRELLELYKYPDDLPVVKGSARQALEESEPSELGTDLLSCS
jgi:elongation factor Tu